MMSFFLIFHTLALHAVTYDQDVLYIFSKMIPRFVLMSSQKEKIKTDIEICILHEEMDELAATTLYEAIYNSYPKGILAYKIDPMLYNYTDINACKDSQLIFLFNTQETNIQNVVKFASKQQIMTLAYDSKLLESGIDMSLFLGRKTTPYINNESLANKKIELDNILLRISKIFHKGVE